MADSSATWPDAVELKTLAEAQRMVILPFDYESPLFCFLCRII